MIITFPYPPARYDAEAARQLVDQLSRVFTRVLSIETASPFALLQAPDGGVWKITVDDLGALHSTKMSLGNRVS